MTAAAKLTFIPDIVEEHFDELQFLWTQRRSALRSPAYHERELLMLEERIEAHAQGLLVIGDRIVDFVELAIAGDEEMPAFAAAVGLLRLGSPSAVERVADAFDTASVGKLHGLRDACATTAAPSLAPRMHSLFLTAPPAVAVAAGEVLVFQGAISPDRSHLERLLTAELPSARAGAWRMATYCAVALPPDWFEAGVGDDDAVVKRVALEAAAWTGSGVFFSHCQALTAAPTPETIDALTMFAAVASPESYRAIEAIALDSSAGPMRSRVVGAFGHPYFIELLIGEMASSDPATAVAAGTAFMKMTGRSVESNTRTKVAVDGEPPPDAFESEFQDEVFLPDPDLARKHWQELAPTLARSPRICRGMDVSQPLSREQFALLDMESRWEYCLRMRLFSGWQGTPLVLERYPQRF